MLPDDTDSAPYAVEPDGSRKLIVHGMRLIHRADGSLERAAQLFSTNQTVRSLELPRWLGDGYLFYIGGSSSTQIWRAKTWTGKLESFANFDFEVGRIVPGFDRLYAFEKHHRDLLVLDPKSGKATDPGSLPPSPDYGQMAFADAWLGAVQVPFRGVLVTFDAGASWRPLPSQAQGEVGLEDGEIVIGGLVLDPSGRLRRKSSGHEHDLLFRGAGRGSSRQSFAVAEETEEDERPQLPPPGPLGRRPLQTAVLHGWPDTPATAVVAHGGTLGRVRLRDGRLLAASERAYPGGEACHAVALGESFGFVCGGEDGKTVVYAFEPPLSMRPVLSFDEPRFVSASGNGALVIRGGCGSAAAPGQSTSAYCVRTRAGRLRPVNVTGDVGVERLVALRDGRTVVLVPPRNRASGILTIVEHGGGGSKSVKLKLPKASAKVRALLRKGLWLDGFVEQPKGRLAGWVVGGGPFVGVRVSLDGKVRVGKLESDVERSLLSGRLALVLGHSGQAYQSTNGGFEWREVEFPVQFDEFFERRWVAANAAAERGCSPVGCVFGPWVRVGWLGPDDDDEFDTPEPPPETARPAARGGRWLLNCAPTGEVAGPRRPVAAPSRGRRTPTAHRHGAFARPSSTPGTLEGTAWLPFQGRPPPRKRPQEIGFDTSTDHLDVRIHGYAWGMRGADWKRVGKWQLRASDRFAVKDAVWSTAVSRSPWSGALEAARAFGHQSSSNWTVALEPSGRAGALVINNAGSHELYLFEQGRSIVHVRGASKWEVIHLAGAVKVGSSWFIGHGGSSGFRVFKIEGDRIDLLRYFPGLSGRRYGSRLSSSVVRSERGDAVGVWVRDVRLRGAATEWFVFPIDAETGRAEEPLGLSPEKLAEVPPPCTEGDAGWLLEGSLPIDPYVDLHGADSVRRPRRMTVRLLASPHGVCVDSLAAQADSAMPARLQGALRSLEAGRPTVPLALGSRGRTGRRWGFRCSR